MSGSTDKPCCGNCLHGWKPWSEGVSVKCRRQHGLITHETDHCPMWQTRDTDNGDLISRKALEAFAMGCVGSTVTMQQIHEFPAAERSD